MIKKIKTSISKIIVYMLTGYILSASATTEFSFNLSALLSTQGLAQEVAIGDVSGDGLNDIIVVNNGFSGGDLTNHVLIYLGRTDGGINAPLSFNYSDDVSGNRGLVLINADDDDSLEALIGHGRQLTLVNQNNSGGFELSTSTTAFSNDVLGSIDVNLDGQLELVAVKTSGSFKPAVFYDVLTLSPILEIDLSLQGDLFEIETADVTGDQIDDFLVINKGSSLFTDLSVFAHDGNNSLLPVTSYSIGNNHEIVSGLATGDFNNDGLNDVFLSQSSATNGLVYTQDRFGELLLTDPITLSLAAMLASASDINTDGLMDIIMLHNAVGEEQAAVGYLLQNSSGFQSEHLFRLPAPLIYELQGMALGDINQDGCTDAAIVDYNQGLMLLLGNGCESDPDLSVDILGFQNQLLISGSHLSGLDVNSATLSVVIETPFQVPFNAEGCRVRSIGRRATKVSCYIGPMSEGEVAAFNFQADISQLPSVLRPLRVTATINSELKDPNPENNTQILNIR